MQVLRCLTYFLLGLVLLSCQESLKNDKKTQNIDFSSPPNWAKAAIYYQIFVERFRNGDPSNDPTVLDIEGAVFDKTPENWKITPWAHPWFQQEDWAKEIGHEFHTSIQMRRYGGDLQGVINKIGYLKELGINTVYFNPLNDSPSLHKYDARSYHHIDINFGPSPVSDRRLISDEIPDDPTTWSWTSADSLFLVCINKMHKNGIRVILDYSWNHTGTEFWAFKDIVKNREESKYKNWYEINDFGIVGEEMDYEGWLNIRSLPELKKIRDSKKLYGHPFEGNIVNPVKQHIFDVSKRWIDPNGDGNFDDGIDGMRLDVAEHVPMGFWRDFRTYVRSLNPDFHLIGENWWTSWPDTLMDPKPWIKGDVFDAIMHYHWYKPARSYFGQTDDAVTLNDFTNEIDDLYANYKDETAQAMMNLTASHDSPRFWSSMANTNKYKYHARSSEDSSYNEGPPNIDRIRRAKLLLLHQFTFVGSPHIWNGDEMGMWGSDDPDCRKPLWWNDIIFDNEVGPFASTVKYEITPSSNNDIFNLYQNLIQLRKENTQLSSPQYKWDQNLIDQGLLSYTRGDLKIIINASARIVKTDNIEGELLFEINEDPDFSDISFFPPFSGKVIRLK